MEFSLVCHDLKNGSDKNGSSYRIGSKGYNLDRKILRETTENIDFLHIKNPIYPSELQELVEDTKNIKVINQLIISSPCCAIPRFQPHKINNLKFVNSNRFIGVSSNKIKKYTKLDTLILENSSIEIVYEVVRQYGSFKKLMIFNSTPTNELNFIDKTPLNLIPYLSRIKEIILYSTNYIWILKSFCIKHLDYLEIVNFNPQTISIFKTCLGAIAIDEFSYPHVTQDNVRVISGSTRAVKYFKPKSVNSSDSSTLGFILCYSGLHIDFNENKSLQNYMLYNAISGSISLLRLKVTGMNLLNTKDVDDFCVSLEYNKSINTLEFEKLKFNSIDLMMRFLASFKNIVKQRHRLISIDINYYISTDCSNPHDIMAHFINRDKKEIPKLFKYISDITRSLVYLNTLKIILPFNVDNYISEILQYTPIENVTIISVLYGKFDNKFMDLYKPYRKIYYSGDKCYIEYKK